MSERAAVSRSPGRLTLSGVATAATAAGLRQQVGAWLAEHGVDAAQVCDVVLAVNEALANVVDHAYADQPGVGIMTVLVDHDPVASSVSVCVTDQGSWRRPRPRHARDMRGRGITLMHAVTDHCTISGRPEGTTVCLDYRIDAPQPRLEPA